MAKHGGVKDSGEHFVINPASRKVAVPHAHKSIATVGDHNSEQIVFSCPQIIDGHDVSQCARRYITWINVNGDMGHDELQVTQVEQGQEGMLYLAWTIRKPLTAANGVVQFSVHFEDVAEDEVVLYRWSTATCKDCDILDSINAVLGVYEAIYVVDDELVIADYTPVNDETLVLDTNGIIPSGTLIIDTNGVHDVGQYAKAQVNVILDEDLIPANIREGVTIGGVTGELKVAKNIIYTVENNITDQSGNYDVECEWVSYDGDGELMLASNTIAMGTSMDIHIAEGSMFYATVKHETGVGIRGKTEGGQPMFFTDDGTCFLYIGKVGSLTGKLIISMK